MTDISSVNVMNIKKKKKGNNEENKQTKTTIHSNKWVNHHNTQPKDHQRTTTVNTDTSAAGPKCLKLCYRTNHRSVKALQVTQTPDGIGSLLQIAVVLHACQPTRTA